MHAVHGNEISSSDAALAEAYTCSPRRATRGGCDSARGDRADRPARRIRTAARASSSRTCSDGPRCPTAIACSAEHDEPWPGGPLEPLPLRHEPRLVRAVAAGDARAADASPSSGARRSSWTCTRWAANRLLLRAAGRSAQPVHHADTDPLARGVRPGQRRVLRRARLPVLHPRGLRLFYPGTASRGPSSGRGRHDVRAGVGAGAGLTPRRTNGADVREGVVHHFIAALTTPSTAAGNRERLLRDFLEYRRTAVAEGERAARASTSWCRAATREGPARLAREPRSTGHRGARGHGRSRSARELPAGLSRLGGAAVGRLVRNLLDPHVPQPQALVKEQDRRRKKRLGDQSTTSPAGACRRCSTSTCSRARRR